MSVNKVILVGHLGDDPEIKIIDKTEIATFRLATNRRYTKSDGQQVDEVEWHNVVSFNKKVIHYLEKGMQIYMYGYLTTKTWQDENKNKKYKTEIIINMIEILTKKN